MKNGKAFIILLGLFVFTLGCKRTQDDYVGPGMGYASKNFAMVSGLTTSTDLINFKLVPKLVLNAQFNEKVAYTITITGTKSGAIKHLKGFSDHVESSWIGNSELIFFQNELCKLELTVMGVADVLSARNVTIVDTYKGEGTLIANMEPGGFTCTSDFWVNYYDPTSKKLISEQIVCTSTNQIVPALEGVNSWKSEGIDLKGGGFLGLAYANPDSRNGIVDGSSNYFYKTGTSNPDSLWFNIFIYGTGDAYAATYIKFMQDDNGDGVHDPKTENGFEQKILDLSHTGWKLFSFRYSQILLGGNSDYGGSGDNIHRTGKIVRIEFALWSTKKGSQVKFIYDYPVFTVGKPFGQ